jgi:hypothetical protein
MAEKVLFIVRVEMHKSDNYKRLHEEMEAKGFRRYLRVKGKKKALPEAMYAKKTSKKSRRVADEAQDAISEVDQHFDLLVVKARSCIYETA